MRVFILTAPSSVMMLTDPTGYVLLDVAPPNVLICTVLLQRGLMQSSLANGVVMYEREGPSSINMLPFL